MTKALLLAFGALLVFSTGCNKSMDSSSKDLAYSLKENNCPTDEHHFTSLDEYCAGLKNESLNNYCAYDLREAEFKSNNCPGSFDH